MSKLVPEYLFKEHQIISEILPIFQQEMAELREGKLPDPSRYEKILRFCRDYADTSHHKKEEDILFQELYPIQNIEGGPRCIYYKELEIQRPTIISQVDEILKQMNLDDEALREKWKHMTREGHIVNPLLEEHILGRSLLQLIEYELQQRLNGKNKDSSSLAYALYRYYSMLAEHIEKEDTCFANTVEKYLSEETQKKIVDRFREMDEGPCRELIQNSLEILKTLK